MTELYDDEFEHEGNTPEQQLALHNMAVQRIMGDKTVRGIMSGLLDSCALDKGIFNADPHQLAYLEGRRSVGIELASMLRDAAPDLYLKMIEESINGR